MTFDFKARCQSPCSGNPLLSRLSRSRSTIGRSSMRSVYTCEFICLLYHCGLEPLKCFISLISINKKFFCFLIYFGQYFHLPVFSPSLKLHDIPAGSFSAGSFAVRCGDHLWSWNLGVICGRGSFAASGSFAALYSSLPPGINPYR